MFVRTRYILEICVNICLCILSLHRNNCFAMSLTILRRLSSILPAYNWLCVKPIERRAGVNLRFRRTRARLFSPFEGQPAYCSPLETTADRSLGADSRGFTPKSIK